MNAPLSFSDYDKQRQIKIDTPIDWDRGVLYCRNEMTGVEACMYKDQPGVYYTISGREVHEQFAKLAGFDVELYGRERKVRENMQAAEREMRKQLNAEVKVEKKVIKSVGGFNLVQVNDLGYYRIEDENGSVITSSPIPLQQAENLLVALVGEDKPKATAAEGHFKPLSST